MPMDSLASLVAQYGMDVFIEHTHTLIAVIEADGKISAWNPSFGKSANRAAAQGSLEEYIVEDDRETCRALLNSARTGNRPAGEYMSLLFGNGEENSTRYDCVVIPILDGRFLFFAELAFYDASLPEKYYHLNRLVAQLHVDYDQVKKVALNKQAEIDAILVMANEVSHVDALTFLPNRRQIINDIQRETLHAERYKTPLTISMLDIDHFKSINDTYGHTVGDEALRHVAILLKDHIREPDICGRYGGEEFLVILPNSDLQAALEQASRLCKIIRETPYNKERVIAITVSIGIAQHKIGDTWKTLLNRADAALYQAKANGRDQWVMAKD